MNTVEDIQVSMQRIESEKLTERVVPFLFLLFLCSPVLYWMLYFICQKLGDHLIETWRLLNRNRDTWKPNDRNIKLGSHLTASRS